MPQLTAAEERALAGLAPGRAARIRAVLAADPDAPMRVGRRRVYLGRSGDLAAVAPGLLAVRDGDDGPAPDDRPPSPATRPELNTPGRRWRFRRNLVIYLAHRRNGLSQRLLADVFGLPRSRVSAVVAEFDRYSGADRPCDSPAP